MTSWRSWIAWLRPATRPKPQSDVSKELPIDTGWSLRVRLLVTVTIALLPIVVLSVLQGVDRARHEIADARARLSETARAAATPEENMLSASEQILRALANMNDVRQVTAGCNHDLADALHGLSFFTNISRLDANGTVVCAALPASVGRSARARTVWREAQASTGFVVSGEIHSPVTNQRVVVGMLPLRDRSGAFTGALAIGLDLRWLDYVVRASKLPKGSVVALFDRQGTIITANRPDIARALFGRAGAPGPEQGAVRSAPDAGGHTWTYATAPLVGTNVFVGFAMREISLLGPTYVNVGADFILPILMIALTWIAIWIVTERQLTRWILYLRRISEAYRRGHYAVRPDLEDAPAELRMLGDALADMADAIQERDRNLREAVAQKTLLVREVHHRVKNNLQIVMSLLSLQAGRLRDPSSQEALRQARARINALALVHRILYEIEDQSAVDIKRLIEDLTEQTHEGFGGDRDEIRVQVEAIPRMASGDTAVPLALFTVEALTNAFKHAFPPDSHGGTIRVTLASVGDGKLRLSVEDDGEGFEEAKPGATIGAQLIRSFGQQVGGTANVHSKPGKGTVSEIIFPDPAAKSPPV
jgi:two-component sensor histidine kinase